MRLVILLAACSGMLAFAADFTPEQQVLQMARSNAAGPDFAEALRKQLPDAKLKDGTASLSYGPDFLFAVESASEPRVSVDDAAPVAMKRVGNSNLYVYTASLKTGRSHAFYYVTDGKPMEKRTDVPAYLPDSYPQPGVPKGTLSEKFTTRSKIYQDMESEYWVYLSPGYDAQKGGPLMVWQDGQNYARENSATRLIIVTENLVQQKKIPPMMHVMIAPGKAGDKAMRSIEYDAVSDRYTRFVAEEILEEVRKKWKFRTDSYSRGIGGESSGGICAFVAAWTRPEQYSRVLSRIGSYTSIEWNHHPDRNLDKEVMGGNAIPFMVRKENKRNIRIWMEDGSNDLENTHGSWPLQNIQLANSLKMREYDFKFTFGNAQHSAANGNALLPEALAWLWRDYDPARTEQTYTMDPKEKTLPYYRVTSLNRQ